MTRLSTFVLGMLTLAVSLGARPSHAFAEPPCDKYPTQKQAKCEAIWKRLNNESVEEVAQFGLAQQKRRDGGSITAEQHLQENMAFIKQSTEKRLKLLDERMARP